jgi:hypothetical protein
MSSTASFGPNRRDRFWTSIMYPPAETSTAFVPAIEARY